MTDPRQRLKELSPEQRDLLLRRLAEAAALDRSPRLEARRRGADVDVPLSFTQESAWFLDRLTPGNPAHNISGALRFEGRLSVPALAATLGEILRRHETLRANFHAADSQPVQVIRAPAAISLGQVDLSVLDGKARQAEGQRLYRDETGRGFDLSRDLLLRATLLRFGEKEHLLLLSLHHIAADGWSVGVLMRELAEIYQAVVQSRPPALAELPIQYGDFAIWQRQRQEGGAYDQELSYWRRQLADPPPALELSGDRSADPGAEPRRSQLEGARCFLRVEERLRKDLEELSREEDTTLFVTLLTAFMVLLSRVTGQEDVLVGSPLSGRKRVETEGLVGRFLNTLALRPRLSSRMTFRQALAAVRKSFLEGLKHAELPFERVVQELDPDRGLSSHPFFEIVFNFVPGQTRFLKLPGLRVHYEKPPRLGAQFSMELFVTEWEGTLELELLYPKGRYSEARMASFLDQLLVLLRQAAGDSDQRLSSLELSTPHSRELLPDPSLPLAEPEQQPVPQAIAEWVRRTPDQPAIRQGETSLSYARLGAGMTAVAEVLQARGLEPGKTVAILGPRCSGIMVAMAGTLLAGGVLLTLAPDLPEERHRLMLREAGARFLLRVGNRRGEDGWLDELEDLEVVPLDAAGLPEEASLPTRPLDRYLAETSGVPGARPGRREPAYVFFTSGSTGEPKGILGSHAGLAHFLAWQRQTFEVGPRDRCAQLTGLSFDVVLRDVFLPLISGATLVLPPDEVLSGAGVLQWLDRERISLLHTVPAVAEAWLADRPPEVSLGALKRVFFAGEPLTSVLVERWRRAFGPAGEIVNLYGPTETTLAKCHYRVPADSRPGIQPLGAAIPQAQALVLTPERGLCGIGEPGEIAVRTPFRSLGFLNAPREMKQRFLVNPFRDDPEDRLYLTGDRGAYSADGLLEFLGRLDHQIKVRGVRVEPAGIAATLRTEPGVAACAVVAREDGPAGTALVAYVVAARDAEKNVGRLQDFLRRRLPAPMIPSAFVFLDALPLTHNQKLDRKRLPAPGGFRPTLESPYVAPRNALELRLVQIWGELLEVRPIGVTDSFFDIGGHSLMALNLLMRIEQRLGRTVPLPAFFENPTIEHLAALAGQEEDEWSQVVSLWPAEHRLKLFLVHPGGGVLWNYVQLVRHLAAEVGVYGLQARGLDGKNEPHGDLEQMAADYVGEIRRLQPEGPYLLAGHSLGGLICYEMARQLRESGFEVALLALLDSELSSADGAESSGEDETLRDARGLADMVETIERYVGKKTGISYETLRGLPSDDQLERVLEALQKSDALPPGAGVEMIRNLLQVSKAHLRARRGYRIRHSEVPVTLVRATDAAQADPTSATDIGKDESLGWSAFSTVRVLWAPGDHVTMMRDPHVDSLARILSSCLAKAVEESLED